MPIAAFLAACSGANSTSLAPTTAGAASVSATPNLTSFAVLHSFGGVPDGLSPESSLLAVNGTLYGTTYHGGAYNNGSVFTIDTSGNEKVLYSFGNGSDAQLPVAGLIDVNGTLYGTAESGGPGGWGTVYSITPGGTETVLYGFTDNDGGSLMSPLICVNGTLYGTASAGGAHGEGVVFSMSTAGRLNWEYSFGGYQDDGFEPYGGLLYENGLLYGTTIRGGTAGGPAGDGTLFSISTSGTGEKVLHDFTGYPSDGSEPYASLTYVKGVLYGTTIGGGAYSGGTVFSVDTSGTEKVLHSFGSGAYDGLAPSFGRLLYVKGRLFGTTWFGGRCKHSRTQGTCGTVFRINLRGSERVVHYFQHREGANPLNGLIKVNDTLYGTTNKGGKHDLGTVFALKL